MKSIKEKKVVSGIQLKNLSREYFKIVINNRISDKKSRSKYLKEFETSKSTRESYISYMKILLNHHSSLEEMALKAYGKDYNKLKSSSYLLVELPKIKKLLDEFDKKFQ